MGESGYPVPNAGAVAFRGGSCNIVREGGVFRTTTLGNIQTKLSAGFVRRRVICSGGKLKRDGVRVVR